MGLIGQIMTTIFGDGSKAMRDTIEVFRPNAEASEQRAADHKSAAVAQFAAEFLQQNRGPFDRLIDGINRLPRPFLAIGTISLFVFAMARPEQFAERMVGIALVPEPLWWLMGAVVSFYFGARHQSKGQDFQRSVVQTVALSQAFSQPAATPDRADTPDRQDIDVTENAALADWEAGRE